MNIGDRFNHLTIKRLSHTKDTGEKVFICRCDCGRERAIPESKIPESETCGLIKGCHATMLNRRYGEWKVIDVNSNFKTKVKAECSCGNIKMVNANDLKNEKTKSCGCSRDKNYLARAKSHIGEKWGRLTILEPELVKGDTTKKNKYYYKCQCECGNIVTVSGQKLWSGHTSSCGCIKTSGEENMSKLLLKLNIPFKREVRFEDCKDKRPLPFDFAIYNQEKELLGLIEMNGGQHYATIGRGFYTRDKLERIQKHDYIKQKFCEDNQIPLMIIPYSYYNPEKLHEFFTTSDFFHYISLRLND